jgi:hypothetical protein
LLIAIVAWVDVVYGCDELREGRAVEVEEMACLVAESKTLCAVKKHYFLYAVIALLISTQALALLFTFINFGAWQRHGHH